MSVEVTNESGFEVEMALVRELAEHAIRSLELHPAVELGITFIDVEPMTELHVKWMDEPGPTDVLSFPMDELRPGSSSDPEGDGVLGDIVVCPEVARQQAEIAGHRPIDEILWLVAHGILHLVGFDHAEPEEERQMFGLQHQIIDSFKAIRSY